VLHTPYHELHARFAHSHLYVAADVYVFLCMAHVWSVSDRLFLTTWPTWAVASCFVLAPLLYNPQQLEAWQVKADVRGFCGWVTGGGWEEWYARLHGPPARGGMAAEDAAWNEQFGRVSVAAFYSFIAYLIPLQTNVDNFAATRGWVCEPRLVCTGATYLASLVALAAADLRPHRSARAPSSRRRRACYVAAATLCAAATLQLAAACAVLGPASSAAGKALRAPDCRLRRRLAGL